MRRPVAFHVGALLPLAAMLYLAVAALHDCGRPKRREEPVRASFSQGAIDNPTTAIIAGLKSPGYYRVHLDSLDHTTYLDAAPESSGVVVLYLDATHGRFVVAISPECTCP